MRHTKMNGAKFRGFRHGMVMILPTLNGHLTGDFLRIEKITHECVENRMNDHAILVPILTKTVMANPLVRQFLPSNACQLQRRT